MLGTNVKPKKSTSKRYCPHEPHREECFTTKKTTKATRHAVVETTVVVETAANQAGKAAKAAKEAKEAKVVNMCRRHPIRNNNGDEIGQMRRGRTTKGWTRSTRKTIIAVVHGQLTLGK